MISGAMMMNSNVISENGIVGGVVGGGGGRLTYVRRGNFYGPIFDVDHLATFTVGSKLG
jgi:hypothetical protein